MSASVKAIFLFIFIKGSSTSFQNLLGKCVIVSSIYFILHPVNFSIWIYFFINICHLLSVIKSRLIQVDLSASINAIIFIIFNPPSPYCFITIACLILLGFLFHKKENIIPLIFSINVESGFGSIIKRWLKADIINVLITVILPKGVNERFPHCLTVFASCWIFIS